MERSGDKPFNWIAALAMASGAAVLVPSLCALAICLGFLIVALV